MDTKLDGDFSYIEELSITNEGDWAFPERIETGRLLLYPLWDFDVVDKREVIRVFEENKGTDEYFGSGFGNPRSEEAFEPFIDAVIEKAEEETHFYYGVVDTERDEFIGHASIEDVEWEKERAEIGVWLKNSVWGEGVSQERAEALLYVVFTELGFEIAEALVATENAKSIRAVEKYIDEFNGSYDGVRRNVGLSPYGDILDIAYYSISSSEFFGEK